MKAQDIKVGNIYFVDFEPVRHGEFDKRHLAVVLKKNHDKITFVVVPFTSQERGLGLNKISLGTIDSLPDNLKAKETFAVINQIRTVNASRFYSLINNGEIIEAMVPGDKMSLLYSAIINDLLQDANSDDIKTVARNLPKK